MKSIILFFLVFLTACCGPKSLVTTQTVGDTIREKKIVLRDTVFQTKTAKVYVEVPIVKLVEKPIIRYKDNVKVILQKVRDTLRITATCDSLELRAQLRDELTHEIQRKETIKTIIQKEKYTPWTTKALAWVGGISLGALAIKLTLNKYLPI